MGIEHGSFGHNPEKKEKKFKYNAIVVAPGYEENKHVTGLRWDTRLRLLAAALLFESGKSGRVVVGGAQIREMKESFAELMKKELIIMGVPATEIDTEEHTFDTASQIDWLQQHISEPEYDNKVAFITDPEQAKHVQELLDGFGLTKEQVDIRSLEDIIRESSKNKHYSAFFERLHKSPYWMQWKAREKLLAIVTRYLDPKGEKMRKITGGRKN